MPAVSFLDPAFTILDDDTADDDQPHTDIRRGDAFLAETFETLANGPAWSSTVLIITFDEWGGFFDHVAPPRAVAPNNVDPDIDPDGNVLLGFRVPTVVASPWTVGNPANAAVNSTVFDHSSILKLIEWRWGLPPLTARDAADSAVGNLAMVLDFAHPNSRVPESPQPVTPAPSPCFLASFEAAIPRRRTQTKWRNLMNSGLVKGWRIRPR